MRSLPLFTTDLVPRDLTPISFSMAHVAEFKEAFALFDKDGA